MSDYSVFNKSSEDLQEILDESIDLIVASVPYNDGTVYGNYIDLKSVDEYKKQIDATLKEFNRVLKDDGKLVVEVADTSVMGGRYVQLAGLWQQLSINNNFNLITRHYNLVQTNRYLELPVHEKDFITSPIDFKSKEIHSNSCQLLVLSKKTGGFVNGQIFYNNYSYDSKEHHCPFSKDMCNLMLNLGEFKKDKSVLEAFMGTGALGVEILKRGGKYYGYEIDKKYFRIANDKFSKIA
jgi:site-specific DNA-methyltransferase (adenine-specific)